MVMPRYQRAGVSLMSMPAVSTVGLQETARTNQMLAQSMDRISNFAFRQAEVQAQVQGREYGALNAPTAQQLQDAVSSGQDAQTLLPGDQSTVFGRSARATALDAVTSQFEIEARNSIVELQSAFEDERIGLSDMQSSLQDLVATQTDIVRRISPEAATKFSASVGVLSNSAFLAAAKEQANRDRKDIEIKVRTGIDAIMMNAETIVKAGATVQDDGTVITVDQKLDMVRQQLAADAQLLNDPNLYQTKIKELNERISEAKINVVLEEAMTTPGRALMVASGQGKFEDEDVQNTFDSMDTPERLALFSKLQSSLSTQFSLESQQDAANTRAREDLVETKRVELFEAQTSGNPEDVDRILEEMREIDEAAYLSAASAVYTEGGIDNAEVISDLNLLLTNNDLTQQDIDAARSSGQISRSTYTTLSGQLKSMRKEDKSAAMRIAKLELGYPDRSILNPSAADREAVQKINQIELQLDAAIKITPDMDKEAFVRQRIQEMRNQGPDQSQLDQATRQIDGLRGLFGLPADASISQVRAELSRRVASGQFNATQATGYDAAFTILENQ
jgi:hypothetical protein